MANFYKDNQDLKFQLSNPLMERIVELKENTRDLCAYLRSECGVWVTEGAQYRGNGAIFVRINIACPRALLTDGLRAFVEGTRRYLSSS